MKFTCNLRPEKKKMITMIIFTLLALALTLIAWAPAYGMIIFAVLLYLFLSIRIDLQEKASMGALPILFLLSSLISTVTVQRVILPMTKFTRIPVTNFLLNMLCCLILYLLVFTISARPRVTCVIVHVFLTLLALADNLIYQFREDEFYPGTLMRVSSLNARTEGYEIALKTRMVWGILGAILFILLLRQCSFTYRAYKWQRLVCGPLTLVGCVSLTLMASDISMETWQQKGSYQNGYLLNFVLGIRDQQLAHQKPEGYSSASVDEIAQTYITEAEEKAKENDGQTSSTKSDNEKPVVITIMSEAFQDFGALGSISTNQEVMPFYNSLTENTIKGYALASVFGCKTPNSEWEFLTGNTMGFLPSGSVSYQEFINENPTSLVSSLKNQGYTCVAMHPYYSGGFSRTTNYTNMGFDEKYFLESFDYQSNNKTIRGFVSDDAFFDKIIERYESMDEDENLYIHAVTMQNHRPYTGYFYKLRNRSGNIVRTTGYGYQDVNNYLSLLHKSDEALEKLITYFQGQDRKVEIIFFGDHSPSLNNEFYKSLNGKGLSGLTMDELEDLYKVPFFIWTNYDIEEEEVDCTSLNYLSTLAMQEAGLELTGYQYFLQDMQEIVPAINSRGYYSEDKGEFIYISEAEGEEARWINTYQQLQYNNMFDEKNINTEMFTGAED